LIAKPEANELTIKVAEVANKKYCSGVTSELYPQFIKQSEEFVITKIRE
jgi:hypothetical protein